MAALTSKALHEQLTVIMGALTKAAVAEICEVVDEGYAVLQMEITRSHKENEDLRKKLHLIESIVVRGSSAGTAASGTEVVPAAQGAPGAETPQQGDGDSGDVGADGGDGGAGMVVQEELPEVVLIKDEDSDSNDTFGEDNKTPADGGTAAAREIVTSAPIRRHWQRTEEAERSSPSEQLTLKTSQLTPKKNVTIYSVDSPRSEPGCSSHIGSDEMDGGELVCSYSSQMDPDVHVVQECSLVPPSSSRQNYFSNNTLMESQSPSNRAEIDLSLTWTKQSKSQMSFAQFHQNENTGQ
ncbi:uncharacterized protein LOC113172078 [Anabas testudineus]|uniref:uncharacterized protein LOC113172078 n=1 Tax=Anabas testudineus TaxID=64144 RepID=UPI000E456EDA|nr:uncharacterized protein LOC113172078 [Anabas testudineus]